MEPTQTGPAEPAEVEHFFDALAEAIVAGDGPAVAKRWGVPAIVIDDAGVLAVASVQQVSDFFSRAAEQYRAMGVVSTTPDIEALDPLTDRILLARVRWPNLDAKGAVVSAERTTYTLRRDDDGSLRIHAAVMH